MPVSFRVLAVVQDDQATDYPRLVLIRTDPNTRAAPTAAADHRRPPPAAAATGFGRPATVLIVNDNADQLDALTAYFQRARATVIASIDTEKALALATDVRPDLIVIAVPPHPDNGEITAPLRSRYPHCPIGISTTLDVSNPVNPRSSTTTTGLSLG